MELHERIRRLLAAHRIERAHFVGGGFVHQLTELAVAAPDLVASLTLVCPFRIPLSLGLDLSMPLSLVSGDRGQADEMVDAVLSAVRDPSRVRLSDFEPMLWDDIALERRDEVLGAITDFLSRVDREVDLPTIRSANTAGMLEELSYQRAGAGRPVVFFPLGLSPSQWEPILGELGKRYTTLSLSGVHTAPTSILEERASTPGYRSMLQSILDRLRPAPGARLLEVGCGCGAVSRWLAEHTRRRHERVHHLRHCSRRRRRGFNLTFDPTSSAITVVDCAGDVGIALCPGTSSVAFGSGDGFVPALDDPFDVGSATLSVAASAALGDAFETRTGSFIDEGGLTFVGGQVYATVVPEPSTALLLGLGVVGMGVRRRANA